MEEVFERGKSENRCEAAGIPAPGVREKATGTPTEVGYGGYSWSSTVSGINGLDLNFYVTWLNPSTANSRGYGFQLRCLSE